MFFKILHLFSLILVCQAIIPEQLYSRRTPIRFLLNNQDSTRPGTNWIYQNINGRPMLSGFVDPNSLVIFSLNPQTGQIEQAELITPNRPGRPINNMIQNAFQVARQFLGQLTGAFGSAIGGALQTAGQFGQDIQDITNPGTSITDINYPFLGPIRQPNQSNTGGAVRPPIITPGPSIQVSPRPAVQIPSVPTNPFSIQTPS